MAFQMCCVGCNHHNNRYYSNANRANICSCYDEDKNGIHRDYKDPHFVGCPLEYSNNIMMKESITVSPKTAAFIFKMIDGSKSNMQIAIEKKYDVTLALDTKIGKPGTEYLDPVITVEGKLTPHISPNSSLYWCIIKTVIKKTDCFIREHQKREEFGMNQDEEITVGVTIESYRKDENSMRIFRDDAITQIPMCCPNAAVVYVSMPEDEVRTPDLVHFTVTGRPMCVETDVWKIKEKEAWWRNHQQDDARWDNPPTCRICEHTYEDCVRITKKHMTDKQSTVTKKVSESK